MKPDDLNREEDTAKPAALNSGRAGAGFAPVIGSASCETLDQWKLSHGINPNDGENQDKLLMSIEDAAILWIETGQSLQNFNGLLLPICPVCVGIIRKQHGLTH